jgi:hypothetical protein
VSRHAVDHDVNPNDAVCYESIDAETGGGPVVVNAQTVESRDGAPASAPAVGKGADADAVVRRRQSVDAIAGTAQEKARVAVDGAAESRAAPVGVAARSRRASVRARFSTSTSLARDARRKTRTTRAELWAWSTRKRSSGLGGALVAGFTRFCCRLRVLCARGEVRVARGRLGRWCGSAACGKHDR